MVSEGLRRGAILGAALEGDEAGQRHGEHEERKEAQRRGPATRAGVASITTSGTAGDLEPVGFRRPSSFERSEVTTGPGNEGAVSAVVLSLEEDAALPAGVYEIARIEVIEKILRCLNLWGPPWKRKRRAPGPPPELEAVPADDGFSQLRPEGEDLPLGGLPDTYSTGRRAGAARSVWT